MQAVRSWLCRPTLPRLTLTSMIILIGGGGFARELLSSARYEAERVVAASFAATSNDWTTIPDPPDANQDLEVRYDGDDTTVSFQVEGGPIETVDLAERSSFKIPKAKLRGKGFVRFMAGGGERGYRVVRIPASK